MRGVNRALVGAQQPPLAQRGDPMDSGQQAVRVIPSGAGRFLVDGPVLISLAADGPVSGPAVSDDRRPWLDVLGDERAQRVTAGVIERRHPAAADALGSRTSTAIPVRTFLPRCRPPRKPGSSPPM